MRHVIFYRKSPVYQKFGFYWAFFLLILAFSQPLVAQNRERIDSLKEELRLRGDVNRYKILWRLAWELFDVENEPAFEYARQAHTLALSQGDSLSIMQSGRIMGQLLRRLHRLDESIDILSKVLPSAVRHNSAYPQNPDYEKEHSFILNGLALAHTFKAEYDKALEYNFRSLVMRERRGDQRQISIALHNIGLAYYKMGAFDLSLDYYLQALRMKDAARDSVGLSSELVDLGLCYNELKQYENSQSAFERALRMCRGKCIDKILMEAEFGLGQSFYQQGNFDEASIHYLKSYELSLGQKETRYEIENILALARLALQDKKHAEARKYLDIARNIPEKEGYKEILRSLYRLEAKYFTATGNFREANEYMSKVQVLYDSTFSFDVVKNLTRVQTLYAQRENLAIIAAKDEVLALNEKSIRQQRAVTILLLAVVALMTALGVVIYRNYGKIKEVNAELASAKQVIEDHNKFLDHLVAQKTRELVDTNAALVKVNDELDNFIYKTSHDIRGPLASLKGMVNLAIMDVKDEKALGYLSKLDTTAEKLNTILTRLLIVNRINNAELKAEQIHFEPIIQEILMLEVKKGIPSKIKIDFEVDPDIHLVTDREMVRLILENLIDNAVKFYNDSERVESFVRIGVKSEDGGVTARIMDNGLGITTMNREKIFQMFVRASERSETGGIGLYLAKLATEKLGGEINLVSTAEKYTEFIVQFPEVMPGSEEKKVDELQLKPARTPIGKQIA